MLHREQNYIRGSDPFIVAAFLAWALISLAFSVLQ